MLIRLHSVMLLASHAQLLILPDAISVCLDFISTAISAHLALTRADARAANRAILHLA